MRKRIASVLMGICVTAFVCSAGSAIYFAQADDATAQPVLTMQEGASIRNFNPVGIRFITKISKEDYTEITAADENAIFGTLILPKEILGENGYVKAVELEVMELGEPDSSGRRRPVSTGKFETVDFDTVIVVELKSFRFANQYFPILTRNTR